MERTPADVLFDKVTELLNVLESPVTLSQVTKHLGINKKQADTWLKRLEGDGIYKRIKDRPISYVRVK